MDDMDPLLVSDVKAWRKWLDLNEDSSDGIWLVLAKKGVTEPTSLSYKEALDEALCSGWIDGQRASLNETTFRQRYTPRRPKSIWSERNVEHIARLTAEGRMTKRGLMEVERAKVDGRWDAAYKGSASIEEPDDLLAALAASPQAAKMFAILTSQNRYAILFRLTQAKTTATRERNIAKMIAMLESGETIHPQKRTLDE